MIARSSNPARVVLLLQDLEFGGSQRHALELARGLDESRFAPEIWTMLGLDDFLPKAREYGIPVRQLTDHRRVGVSTIVALFRALASERIDILSLLTVVPNIWGRVFARLFRYPAVVANTRGIHNLKRQHERFTSGLPHFHITNADIIRRRLVDEFGYAPQKVQTIPNSVDTEYFQPVASANSGVTILSVGRMVPDKDPLNLAHAFSKLAGEHAEVRLSWVGDGPLMPQVQAVFEQNDIMDRVTLHGSLTDIRPQLAEADVFVLPSRSEGLPNAVLEAMASGLPVVGTTAGGVPELVDHGRTGLVVNVEAPEELAAAMKTLLDDKELRFEYGAAGREKAVECHSRTVMVARYEAVFEQLLKES